MVGLASLSFDAIPSELSGGQQRRLALAVQLIRSPYLLLLDEPTAGLDWSMRQNFINVIKHLKTNMCLLIGTHDPDELFDIADSYWIMDNNSIVKKK